MNDTVSTRAATPSDIAATLGVGKRETPWWRSWWFILITGAIVLAVGWLMFRPAAPVVYLKDKSTVTTLRSVITATGTLQPIDKVTVGAEVSGRMDEILRANVPFAFHPSRQGDAAMVRDYFAMIRRAGTAQLIRQNRDIMARPDSRPLLRRLQCPVLVVCGDADALTPPECSREVAAAVPRAELHVLPACGHLLTWEQPEAVNALLRAWLARLEPGPVAGPRARAG
jgi:pimeloyl-ACP methyl ester carboxylesterase